MIYEKKKYGDKNIIPAGLLYYNIQDPIVEAKKDDDEVEALIRKELRMKGVVNSNKNIISMMDSTDGSSVNIPVSYNKSGELDMRYSRVMTTDEFDKLGEYVDKENVNNAGKILNGSININPYIKGNENSCTYCQYNSVCGFSTDMPGTSYRRLSNLSKEDIWKLIDENNSGEAYSSSKEHNSTEKYNDSEEYNKETESNSEV